MEIAIIPVYFLKHLSSNFLKRNDYNILISNILILLIFLIFESYLITILNYIPHFCLIDKIIGIECPVCGTTRAFCELSSGNLNNAFNLNRTSVFVALFFIFQIPLRIVSILGITKTYKINKISKIFSRVLITLIFLNWIINLLIN